MRYLPHLILAAAALGFASPALAAGEMNCQSGPQKNWKSQATLKARLAGQGWQVLKTRIDGGCYEVSGTDPQGRRVQAYFHPVTLHKLLVSRRGKTPFRVRTAKPVLLEGQAAPKR